MQEKKEKSKTEERYLFETAYTKDYEHFERVYDTETQKSIVRRIEEPSEWFEESINGDYRSVTNLNKMFTRKQGRAQKGQKIYQNSGYSDSISRRIRDNYWLHNYHKNPRIFFLDIETRSGQSYFYSNEEVEVRKKE